MNHPSMEDPRAKFAQATKHANHFNRLYKSWRLYIRDNSPINMPELQAADKIVFSVKTPPPDPRLALIIGDTIHNLRVSLDHLISQIAMFEGHDIGARSSLAFPIFISKADYAKNQKSISKNFIANQAVHNAVEALQPFNSDNPKSHPLWLLSNLDNIDKHRTLVVVAPRIKKRGEAILSSGPAKNHQQQRTISPYTMDFQIEIQPDNPVFTESSATHSITFSVDTTLVLAATGLMCDGWPLPELLSILSSSVREILDEFEKQFFLTTIS